jgi:hypothetical protein
MPIQKTTLVFFRVLEGLIDLVDPEQEAAAARLRAEGWQALMQIETDACELRKTRRLVAAVRELGAAIVDALRPVGDPRRDILTSAAVQDAMYRGRGFWTRTPDKEL